MTSPDPEILWLALAAFFLPLVSFLISFSIPTRYSWIAPLNSTLILLTSTVFSIILISKSWNEPPVIFQQTWFHMGANSIHVGFRLDNLAVLMMVTVSVISFLVHLYSTGFMAGEAGARRYFAMLGFFTFSMLGIVMASNLLMVFVFWELVGFSSYWLIGFWQERPMAVAAATKAYLVNRIGDVGFLIGLMMLWMHAGSLDIDKLRLAAESISGSNLTLLGFCIFFGVMAKSAQFPLYTWLPDAMEGPMPVSALIHAATMVAAGVFLIGRIYFLFTPDILFFVALVGAATALTGAVSALVQFDIKRILAYSTISQLGLMIMCMGAGDPSAAELHLVTHAFFKACLFLSAGAAIHVLQHASHQSQVEIDVQDIRHLGGLARKMPLVFFVFAMAACSLSGLPFFSGFISKEGMLTSLRNPAFLVAALATSFFTVVYTFRMVWIVFLGPARTIRQLETGHFPFAPLVMRIPLVVLAAASTWLLISINPIDLRGWVAGGLHPQQYFHAGVIALISLASILFGLIFSYFFYRSKSAGAATARFDLLRKNFALDHLYKIGFVKPVLTLSLATDYIDKKWIDSILHFTAYAQVTMAHLAGWCDRIVVDGAADVSGWLSKFIGSIARSLVNGKIQAYIFWAMVGLIVLMVWILYT